jgi:hypothetical protein
MTEVVSQRMSISDRPHADVASPRSRWARPRMALVLGALTVLLFATSVALTVLARESSSLFAESLLLPFAAVGVVVAYRQPSNPIGWIMLATTIVMLFGGSAGLYAVLVFRQGHHGLPLGRLAVALSPGWIAILLLPLPILLFPDGHVPTGRWRVTVWAYGAVCLLFVVATGIADAGAFTDRPLRIDSGGNLAALDRGSYVGVTVPLFLLYAAIALSWVVRQVVAFRSSTGERREQLKWLISGGTTAIIGLVASMILNSSRSTVGQVLSSAGLAGVTALPISIGVGILKYRLYEIDRLISRTLSYAIVTGLLAATFVGVVALTTQTLPFSSSVGVATSTLAAAALFNPLRGRVQRIVDGRFNRARYDAELTVAAFAARLRDAVDLDTVQSELLDTVERSVEPSHASVWIRPVSSR